MGKLLAHSQRGRWPTKGEGDCITAVGETSISRRLNTHEPAVTNMLKGAAGGGAVHLPFDREAVMNVLKGAAGEGAVHLPFDRKAVINMLKRADAQGWRRGGTFVH